MAWMATRPVHSYSIVKKFVRVFMYYTYTSVLSLLQS
ncbi:hypothetical protein SLEP1_g52794 [Rubroshorea leprosula]|uniref:Uncharacterized protein n=1 Tax=Rubroshorea leprosula TaxID=152421 RepID=A0AAV5M7D7_9ROSI|nr:hypothetical protein SLEP1_g52794 [Rubroshorea leprosula]